jgi:hypothetical protein
MGKLLRPPNTDGIGNCLRQPGQLHRDTKLSSPYRDFAKTHDNPDTDGNIIKPPGH